MTTETIHVFEQRGLGKAPFKFIGMEHQEIRYGERVLGTIGGVTFTTKPGGTCDNCGMYIVNMFNIESADGKRFHVGCDCVLKTGDAGLKKVVDRLTREINSAKRRLKKLHKEDLDKALVEKMLPLHSEALAAKPHPHEGLAAQGKTLLDYITWNTERGNFDRAACTIEKALGLS